MSGLIYSTANWSFIPKNKDAYYDRGKVKHVLQDYTGAIEDYSKAIELDPEHKDAYYFRGLSKIFLGLQDSGCLDLKKARDLGHPQASEAINKYCQ
jgi:tetratricopeptide (TPR) repeat protein